MKIDRLIAIMNYLLCHGKTSAQKLSEEFEVSVRTIVRDMETLGQAGIPIQSTCGADGGYSIMDTYILDRKVISHQDYDHIITALYALLSAYADKSVKQTMDKLLPFYAHADAIAEARESCRQSGTSSVRGQGRGVFSDLTGNKGRGRTVHLDFSVASENRGINESIKILESAIIQQRAVTFRYTNNENMVKQLEVEPVRLEFKWYNWYLIAFHLEHQDYCMFKLVRMEEITVLERENTVNHEERDIVLQDDRKVITVTLRGNAAVRAKCREYLNGEITKELENGGFEFQFCVPESEVYWYGVILSFGNNVTILEPQSVIDRILATCDEVQRHYEKDGGE
ncbi:MAG: WYL domain-containing protein [Lachnospiraceae bacterium]|nr:WYL domain-containing protein [Lachnospiraceae bacterium]